MSFRKKFPEFSGYISDVLGHPLAFILALSSIIIWGISGPIFDYSDTWQLIVNTGTSIVTYLMVFLIQNTQNQNGDAMQMKIDELIRATKDAQNSILDLESLSEEDIKSFKAKYKILAEKARIEMALEKITHEKAKSKDTSPQ